MNSFLQRNKRFLAEKLADLSNYILIGLVFGQLVSDKPILLGSFIAGMCIFAILGVLIYYILK